MNEAIKMSVNDVTEEKIVEYLELAEATPKRLAQLTAHLDDSQLAYPPAPDEWSVLQILNHLRACEEVWMHSLHAMLAYDKPNLKEIHPRQWIKKQSPYTSLAFSDSLQVFALRREALLLTLRGLSLDDWARECRLDRKTHSVFSHVRRMVLHENTHCDQIEDILDTS
jgi:hypothetical protein